jgi:hypothetical protein
VVTDISAAGQEQSQGIEEVNNAITQMDETTQQNAALVEQAAAAAQSMQEQAARLSEAVSLPTRWWQRGRDTGRSEHGRSCHSFLAGQGQPAAALIRPGPSATALLQRTVHRNSRPTVPAQCPEPYRYTAS